MAVPQTPSRTTYGLTEEVLELRQHSRRGGCPAVDTRGGLLGMITPRHFIEVPLCGVWRRWYPVVMAASLRSPPVAVG